MKSVAFAALTSAAAAISADELEFVNFASRFNKIYKDVKEYAARFEIFAYNHKFIKEHNATKSTYTLGHNHMSDWTDDEYFNILNFVMPENYEPDKRNVEVFSDDDDLPDYVNWVEAGGVTPVKN